MIGWLRGRVHRKTLPTVILDVQGVGYELDVPVRTYEELPGEGEEAALEVLTVFRGEEMELYGFSSLTERTLFKVLIGISGIGPRLALSMVSSLTADELHEAIRTGRTAPLERVPGIGRKTAQRLLVELTDRLPRIEGEVRPGAPASSAGGGRSALEPDAVSALVNLGYREADAQDAVRRVLAEVETGDLGPLIREALRRLGR
jgi:Holliday junction DNA helicase RuvA